MKHIVKIGTRDSALAVWQAKKVQTLLAEQDVASTLVYIKSEGDINLTVPLYEIGVQGIFTKALDVALLQKNIDVAVHSYKDVPTQLAKGIVKAAVLKRDSYKDVLIYKAGTPLLEESLGFAGGKWLQKNSDVAGEITSFTIATSSIRRRAQWLHRYPHHTIDNLRGNINSRLRKLEESNWQGAIFAAAGLDRINLRPPASIELDWMLPAPAQGAVVAVCRAEDQWLRDIFISLNDMHTDICTGAERDFLRALSGGCSTPISALAQIDDGFLHFKGSITSVNGKETIETERKTELNKMEDTGKEAALEILANGGDKIIESIRNGGK
ncbi:hydroxymethylbilane synthase [Agriterribacter sp.]|uniref:hydroxymethylbilane synthase n=1 Tax=Agriterribacter sp. TaxID=2821509 RepID=UPI002BFB7496|nr:hydroxymethylbilane synthase [Agriterribacter sp.]HRO44452.1 hydroxymethylbilane synthase [Agriterribacter sp.]HRQ16521.1 hydroxymethylbilane synthase [Agriterribacter sp.]